MRKLQLISIIFVAFFYILSSCGAGSEDSDNMQSNDGTLGLMNINKEPGPDKNYSPPPPPPPPSNNETQENIVTPEGIEKKIIKTAEITIEVKDVKKTRKSIETLIKKYKSYVSTEKETNSSYEISNSLTIRILSNSFDSLINEIGDIAYNIDSKNISLDDVTEEYIDITARLKNKKEVETQYLEILKKARTIEEILNVNEHLRIIREEIESKEGRLKYLESQVSYSTINLYMYQKSEKVYKGFGYKLVEGFEGGWKGILTFLIILTYTWPLILIMIAGIWFIRKRRKKKLQV